MSIRDIDIREDLWEYLTHADKPILLYGMGNGADKILAVCEARGICVADTFASDGFVRGHSFHGKTVLSYSEAKQKYNHFIVLLSFASSLPDVLELIHRVAAEQELYAPDVPVFGNTLFDRAFFEENRAEFEEVETFLADEKSVDTLEKVIRYKLTGSIAFLDACESDEEEAFRTLLDAEEITHYTDLGAYNGDTVRKLLPLSPKLTHITALEPDRRNFRKLSEYAETVRDRVTVEAHNLGAWSERDTLFFDSSGNRNAGIRQDGNAKKITEVSVDTVDSVLTGRHTDFIKYDVEGSEKEALLGSSQTIAVCRPRLLVSLYHRSEDLFLLPKLVKRLLPSYRLYLRKLPYIPAWDLNLYTIERKHDV
ncbi:MAG: FkbM family methyltransferase [Clostridia bacterium]|nr:FkbM family methyltransferase [Clostridia bacterium]